MVMPLLMMMLMMMMTVTVAAVGQNGGMSPDDVEDGQEMDLLALLHVSGSLRGVSALPASPSEPGGAFKLRRATPELALAPREAARLAAGLRRRGSLGLAFWAKQARGNAGAIFSIGGGGEGDASRTATNGARLRPGADDVAASGGHDDHPLLELWSSYRADALRLHYRSARGTVRGGSPASLTFPGGSPFLRDGQQRWARVALSLSPRRVALMVECDAPLVLEPPASRPGDVLDLRLPPAGARVVLSGSAGYWRMAKIFPGGLSRRPWHCPGLQGEPYHDGAAGGGGGGVRGGGGYQSIKEPPPPPPILKLDTDTVARVAARPPLSSGDAAGRLSRLEQEFQGLATMLDMLKAQNVELVGRVKQLESCECRRPACEWQGRARAHDERWEGDACHSCSCRAGSVECVPRADRPECAGCSYDGKIYKNQETFHINACTSCVCVNGDVSCKEEECARAKCRNSVKKPGVCCPTCPKDCEGGHAHAVTWAPDDCTTCRCTDGVVECQVTVCAELSCPVTQHLPGQCCPSCRPGCEYEGQHYKEGQFFTANSNPCLNCSCLDSLIRCSPVHCRPLACRHPVQRPGQCCPECRGCLINGQALENGEMVNPGGGCQKCTCLGGELGCDRGPPVCELPSCPHPGRPEGQCCPACDGCEFEGQAFRSGETRPSPLAGPCIQCTCTSGTVHCVEEVCPPLPCTEPHVEPGRCCPMCRGCVLDGKEVAEGSRVEGLHETCPTCRCLDGQLLCNGALCLPTLCQHPARIAEDCCAICDRCSYRDRVFSNGQAFTDPSDPCLNCLCQDGTVTCDPAVCPPTPCSHPEKKDGHCCPRCPDCTFEDRVWREGERFPNPAGSCQDCVCHDGRVECRERACPQPACPHSTPGACCASNCNGCSYAGKDYPNGMEFPHSSDDCRVCHCINGKVQCPKKRCPVLGCPDPLLPPGACCPTCPEPPVGCVYLGVRYDHAQRFYDPSERCRACVCANGTVTCMRRPCPPAPCSHPRAHACCPSCDGCLLHGVELVEGERRQQPGEACRECVCAAGSVTCHALRCPAAACPHPARRHCCPSCDGCGYLDSEYLNGQEFEEPGSPCRVCVCSDGAVTCRVRPCPHPARCTHPAVPRGTCCPACDGCVVDGVTHKNGVSFPDPADDVCSRCTCSDGSVVCARAPCAAVACSHATVGACECPVCDGCRFQGRDYADGDAFPAPKAQCQDCTCKAGSVHCTANPCPPLRCVHQFTVPGECCPQCQGCVYEGRVHEEGSAWVPAARPCLACACHSGVVTCSAPLCLAVSPCTPPTSDPGDGRCCPRCSGCVHGGVTHKPGHSFQPSHDPCEICFCEELSSGEHVLHCERRMCPSLVDCPHASVQPPPPGSCCPTCTAALGNCSLSVSGRQVYASEDPCYMCECQEITWVCVRQLCPTLSCPLGEQFTPPESCCPICEERRVPCVYAGRELGPGARWAVDECTRCACVGGNVHCSTERCAPPHCPNDEIPTLTGGACCPRCLPRPATCVVFGDPHYRTFDGATVHFQGSCSYTLAQDCTARDFTIQVTNDNRGLQGVSWTRDVLVRVGDAHVWLLQDWEVKVKGETVTLPYLKEPHLYVERKANHILLNTNIGLKVLWNGKSHLEVSVPGSYKERTCGLCGNFNGIAQDDTRLPSNAIASSHAHFGNSWKVTDTDPSSLAPPCEDVDDVDPCRRAGYRAHREANARCRALRGAAGGAFAPCRAAVPPAAFYAACVYDLCACAAGLGGGAGLGAPATSPETCLCDVLEAYAARCHAAGVHVQWRTATLCAVSCPTERGYVFDECGPRCPRTCYNRDVPLGVVEAACLQPCVPGCQCPAGLVEHLGACVRPDACPSVVYGDDAGPVAAAAADTA
ncbi:unnamed protein product [Lampetra fluviatilis]